MILWLLLLLSICRPFDILGLLGLLVLLVLLGLFASVVSHRTAGETPAIHANPTVWLRSAFNIQHVCLLILLLQAGDPSCSTDVHPTRIRQADLERHSRCDAKKDGATTRRHPPPPSMSCHGQVLVWRGTSTIAASVLAHLRDTRVTPDPSASHLPNHTNDLLS